MSESYILTTSSKGRRHSIAAGGAEVKNPRRFSGLFKSQRNRARKKKRPNSIDSGNEEGSVHPLSPLLLKPADTVRVIATALHPQVYYKTLSVKPTMTVGDVIVALVDRYAESMEDQSPDTFYLTEVQDTPQGSYSRVLEGSDRIDELKARWRNEKDYYFCICRKQFIPRSGSDAMGAQVEGVLPTSHSFSEDVFSSTGNNTPSVLSKQMFSSSLIVSPTFKPGSDKDGGDLVESSSGQLGTSLSSIDTEGGEMKDSRRHHVLQSGPGDGTSLNADNLSISLPGVHAILECPDIDSNETNFEVCNHRRRNSSPLRRFQIPLQNHAGSGSTVLQAKSTDAAFLDHVHSISGSQHRYDLKPAPPSRKRHYSYSGRQSQSTSTPASVDDPRTSISLAKSDGKLNQRMRRSISEGLDGIMKKVVGEKKHIDFSTNAKAFPTGGELATQTSGGVEVRDLVCSPLSTAEKKFPEFVFTPGDIENSKETADSNESTTNDSELREQFKTSQEKVARKLNLDEMQPKNLEDQQLCRDLSATSATMPPNQIEEQIIIEQVTAKTLPYSNWRTSRTLANVTFEARLTVEPQFHSTASIYPSFLKENCQFNTEMNILESISTFLNSRIAEKSPSSHTHHPDTDTTSNGEGKSQTDLEDCSASLISKSRRSKLINLAASKAIHRNKVSTNGIKQTSSDQMERQSISTQSTENDCELQEDKKTAHEGTWTTSPLISSKRRAQLVKLAASRFRKRQRSKDENHDQSATVSNGLSSKTPSILNEKSILAARSVSKLPTTNSGNVFTSKIAIPAQSSQLPHCTLGEAPSDLDSLIRSLPNSPRKRRDKGASIQRVSSAGVHHNGKHTNKTRSLRVRQYSEPHLYIPAVHNPSISSYPTLTATQPVSLNNSTSTKSEALNSVLITVRPKSAHNIRSHRDPFSSQLQELDHHSKHYKSLETLTLPQTQREVLCTFPSNKRPFTVLVRGAKSSSSLNHTSHEDSADLYSPIQ